MKDEYKEMVCRVRFIDGVPAKTYLSDIEIVRCKDCKYYRGYAGVVDGYCYMAEWYKRYQYPDDFCSRAERKEHETD